MKPVDGIDLPGMLQESRREYAEETTRRVKERIAHILGKRRTEIGSIAALEHQLAKAKERLEKEEEKLRQLQNGNWGVLEDEPLPKVTIQGAETSTQPSH